jgi:hypothetical protein
MGWLLNELVATAGPRCESEVQSATRRWRERVEPVMREVTRLHLNTEQDRSAIRIGVNPGLPEKLRSLDNKPEQQGKFLLSVYRPDLEAFLGSSKNIQTALARLDRLGDPWSNQTKSRTERVTAAEQVVQQLLDAVGTGDPVRALLEYDEDVLGIYRSAPHSNERNIELYWAVIGSIAKQLKLSVDALTAVALTHELAHAYSHLGADIQGNRWDTQAFAQSESQLKEGLAQYYTQIIAVRLAERREERVAQAYNQLLPHLLPLYNAHLPWIEEFSPEMVRAAMLELRLKEKATLQDFAHCLRSAKNRMSLQGQ